MALTPEQKEAWEREKAERETRRKQEQEQARIKKAEDEKKITEVVNKAEERDFKARVIYYAAVLAASVAVVFLVLWIQSLI